MSEGKNKRTNAGRKKRKEGRKKMKQRRKGHDIVISEPFLIRLVLSASLAISSSRFTINCSSAARAWIGRWEVGPWERIILKQNT